MNKLFLRITVLLVVIGLLVGCGAEKQEQNQSNNQNGETTSSESSEEKNEDTVIITLSMDNGSEYINEKEVPIEDGTTLMETMEKNFLLDTNPDSGTITSIDGVAPKEEGQKAWVFTVNGETPSVGAKEYELSPGDKVVFDLHAK